MRVLSKEEVMNCMPFDEQGLNEAIASEIAPGSGLKVVGGVMFKMVAHSRKDDIIEAARMASAKFGSDIGTHTLTQEGIILLFAFKY